ncbi:MAG: flagellar M-ring protein FliF [Bdellovibrio sp.]|nr:flagellar M-ring protein FliF [Bdellovibrio sp.]
MGEYLNKVFVQIREFVKSLSPGKRFALFGVFVGIVAVLALMVLWAGNTNFVPLMTNLSPEDSTNIIRILRDKHIPFKVDPTGKNISIPPESMYELRLELATIGLPQSSIVGYEVFDKQQLGATSFIQKVNQKRAQEGELMRTINTIRGVRRSRVHLAIPQKSAFVEDQKKSTASVVVDLEPGTVLAEKQVFGIGNLVARAIEGLDITDVVIMNSEGKVLSKNPTDPLAASTATQLDFQEKLQGDMERRIENMLSRVVGEGHVVAKVTAELDFAQVNETQTIFDGDGAAIRSVEKHNDSMNGSRPGPYGAAGNTANAPGQTPNGSNGEVKTETSKNNEVTNYEVPQTVRRTTRATGAVKKLSVAVVVDSKTTKTTAKDGVVTTKLDAWPPEKLKEFEEIAAGAVGLDRKRGDTLDVKNIEFTREDFEEAQRFIAEKETKSYIQNMIMYGVIGLAILLFFMWVVRPFIKWVTENTIDSVDTFLPQTIEELERIQKNTALPVIEEVVPVLPENMDPAKVEGEMIKEKIITLIEANPHKAALILRDWLHGESKKKEEANAAKKKESA